MKTFFISAYMALLLVFGTGCASTSSSGDSTSKSPQPTNTGKTVTITMYDNYPQQESSAILAELIIKASVEGYDGSVSFSFVNRPTAANLKPVFTYYGYCEGIRRSIMKGTGKDCVLTFNTSANGSGIPIDLSTSDTMLNSILQMIAQNKTTVYAIYTY